MEMFCGINYLSQWSLTRRSCRLLLPESVMDDLVSQLYAVQILHTAKDCKQILTLSRHFKTPANMFPELMDAFSLYLLALLFYFQWEYGILVDISMHTSNFHLQQSPRLHQDLVDGTVWRLHWLTVQSPPDWRIV